MNKRRSILLMISLMFYFALSAAGCAQTGADTMGGSSMEMSNDSMENSMDKDMDTMDERKMDGSMNNDMQDKMK